MYQPEDSAQAPAAPTAVLTGLGSWLPPHEITNDELCAHLDTSDTWIRERIGISVRRRADPKTATGDLAAEAGAALPVALDDRPRLRHRAGGADRRPDGRV
ncbi:hypothetical protein ABT168_12535, partial [Streptomyces sp. NPDC001793]